MDLPQLLATIRPLLEGRATVVFLFGSRARGSAHAGSDVDLAFVPVDPNLSLAEEAALQSEIARALGLPVDWVRLDLADARLQWEIARQAVVVLSEPPALAARWLARIGIAHADEGPAVEAGARRFLERVAGGR